MNAIDVLNFFKVLPCKILFSVKDLIDLGSESFLNYRILDNVVNHHHEKMCCGISTSCEKCTELIDNIINCVFLIFLLLITSQVVWMDQCLNQVSVNLLFSLFFICLNRLDFLFDQLSSELSESFDAFIDLAISFVQTKLENPWS